MNVVLDTNVLMSGIFWSGVPARILELWGQGRFNLLISPQIYGEYREINLRLSEKFGLRSGEKVLQTIFFRAKMLEPEPVSVPFCQDPDDVMFLELAVSGKAQYLISGDKHLLAVNCYPGGKVITPSDFLALIA